MIRGVPHATHGERAPIVTDRKMSIQPTFALPTLHVRRRDMRSDASTRHSSRPGTNLAWPSGFPRDSRLRRDKPAEADRREMLIRQVEDARPENGRDITEPCSNPRS